MSPDNDDMDDTLTMRVMKRVRKENKYDGEERRGKQGTDMMKYLPLLLACLSGVWGYATLVGDVRYLSTSLDRVGSEHKEDMTSYLGWNKDINQRLRALERAP